MASQALESARRQERIGSAVWGLTLMVMGALFMLDSLGTIDMGARSQHSASRAVDGDPKTRWSSTFSDPQWIMVDLGSKQEITRIRLNWEAAYATAYRIEVSDDGSSWTTVADVANGHGGIEEHNLSASGRFVRLDGTRRATPWGYSLWELEVYGQGKSPISQGKSATASSREGTSYWLIFWPVLLIAAGLPALIAPKDPGNQVLGLILTSTGLVLQARNLGLLPWSFNETLAVLLILTGTVLVLQALRGAGARPGAPSDPPAGSTRGSGLS
jgi:hypothetical protein